MRTRPCVNGEVPTSAAAVTKQQSGFLLLPPASPAGHCPSVCGALLHTPRAARDDRRHGALARRGRTVDGEAGWKTRAQPGLSSPAPHPSWPFVRHLAAAVFVGRGCPPTLAVAVCSAGYSIRCPSCQRALGCAQPSARCHGPESWREIRSTSSPARSSSDCPAGRRGSKLSLSRGPTRWSGDL
jgi:hypothetical protein